MYIFVYTFVKLISTMKKHLLILATALISISTFSQIPNYVPANGLVGWWPFNGNANDESGNGNNGTVNGATLTSDRFGNANQAYSFDGVNDIINTNTNAGNFGTSDFSISSWVSDLSLNNAGVIVGKRLENSNILEQGWGNGPSFEISSGIPSYFTQSINGYSLNTWYNYTMVRSGLTIHVYINGNLVQSYSAPAIANINNAAQLSFGARYDYNQASEFINAIIDDIGIWNRALTQCEIQALYHAQVGSQAISAGQDQSICSGDPVTLNGSGGSSYQWNNNVLDGQAFTPSQSANYVLNGTDSLGCQGTDTVVVTVLENATSTLTQTALDSYTLNGQTYTQSGTYTQIVPAANGCDSTITLNLTLNFTGINELGTSAKKLVSITDLNGKIIPRRKNTLMLFIYEDGTVERVVEIEE